MKEDNWEQTIVNRHIVKRNNTWFEGKRKWKIKLMRLRVKMFVLLLENGNRTLKIENRKFQC